MGHLLPCAVPLALPHGLAQSGDHAPAPLTPFLSYSPYPAALAYDLTETRNTSTADRDILHPEHNPITIPVKQPIAHFVQGVEIRNVRLIDYALPWRTRPWTEW